MCTTLYGLQEARELFRKLYLGQQIKWGIVCLRVTMKISAGNKLDSV